MTTKRPPGRPTKEVKPQQFSIRLLPAEMEALKSLATLYGTSLSGAVESCVQLAWAEVPAEQRRALTTIRKAKIK